MPNEFEGLKKVTGGAKKMASRVQSWAKSSKWNTENEIGENPFSDIKSLVDLNAKYKEVYGKLGEAAKEPDEAAQTQVANTKNQTVKTINMYYQLQRFAISRNFIELLKPFDEELKFAAKDNDKAKVLALKRELTDILKTFKINNYYNGHNEKDASYLIDLIEYLTTAYKTTMSKSGSAYKKLKKEIAGLDETTKSGVLEAMKNGFAAMAEKTSGAVKAGVEKAQAVKANVQAPIPEPEDLEKAPEPEEKKPLEQYFKVDEKMEDSLLTATPPKKKVTIKLKSK